MLHKNLSIQTSLTPTTHQRERRETKERERERREREGKRKIKSPIPPTPYLRTVNVEYLAWGPMEDKASS